MKKELRIKAYRKVSELPIDEIVGILTQFGRMTEAVKRDYIDLVQEAKLNIANPSATEDDLLYWFTWARTEDDLECEYLYELSQEFGVETPLIVL